MTTKYIETLAETKLMDTNCFAVPVDVFLCARKLNVNVEAMEAEDEVCGVFIYKNGTGKIGYNSEHHVNRQRFTVAHELGHFVLHADTATLFVDKGEKIMYREKNPSKEEHQERQANEFAAALLMPEKFVKEEFIKMKDQEPDVVVSKLSTKFQVSQIAMTIRLANLHLIEYGLGLK